MQPPSPFYFFPALVPVEQKKQRRRTQKLGGQAGTQGDFSDPTIFSRLRWVLSPAFLPEKAQERFTWYVNPKRPSSQLVSSEKAMASHSSTLAWKIPWMEESGGLQSMGSRRLGHDWATSLSLFTFMHWRRKWQPTPVFLPGESQGRGSLVGCRLWGRTESETTEVT